MISNNAKRYLFRCLFILLALILLLASGAESLPGSNASWTEEPWIRDSIEASEKATALSMPLAFKLNGSEPFDIYLAPVHLNFSDYASSPFYSELWIRKGMQWSRSSQAVPGEDVDVILHMPEYGNVDLYLIFYARGSTDHWSFKLLEGYHLLRLTLAEEGRHFMLASQDSTPGNAIVIDAVSPSNAAPLSPLDVGSVSIGKSRITVKSLKTKGYDVYLDGVFYSSDIGDGSLDGIASLTVGSGKTHTIAVSQRDIQGNIINTSEHTKVFKRDMAYTLLIQ